MKQVNDEVIAITLGFLRLLLAISLFLTDLHIMVVVLAGLVGVAEAITIWKRITIISKILKSDNPN